MRAIPARSNQLRQLSRPHPPVEPCEDRAADEKEQECAGQEVFHVRENSPAAVI